MELKTNQKRFYSYFDQKEIKKIKFYSVNDPFGEFSNFAQFPIQIKSKSCPTVEHYFQAQKFKGTAMEEKIRKATTPIYLFKIII